MTYSFSGPGLWHVVTVLCSWSPEAEVDVSTAVSSAGGGSTTFIDPSGCWQDFPPCCCGTQASLSESFDWDHVASSSQRQRTRCASTPHLPLLQPARKTAFIQKITPCMLCQNHPTGKIRVTLLAFIEGIKYLLPIPTTEVMFFHLRLGRIG